MVNKAKTDDKLLFLIYLAMTALGLAVINAVFRIFSAYAFFLIFIASAIALCLHLLQARHRGEQTGRLLAALSAVYNPLALTALIVLIDYRTTIWLLLFMVNMLRNPYLGFAPSVLNGAVTVLCFNFLAARIYHLNTFEMVFGSLVFFTAAMLAWVFTLKLWLFEQQSMRDGLTGLRNRRSFNISLRQEIKQCLQEGRPISLLMIDVDNFKKYNDTMGHVKGDEILKRLAGIMTANIRGSDLVFRYGGEEFCIILPGVGSGRAEKIAERIREHVESSFASHEVPITVSIGISSSEGDDNNAHYLLEHADRAMYRAKILKNRVVAT